MVPSQDNIRYIATGLVLLIVSAFAASPAIGTDHFSPADYGRHIESLKQRLPNDGFHIILQPPFIVIGDEFGAMVRRRTSGTIQWAVERLKKDFFSEDPNHIVDIWLFKDKSSYEIHTEQLFGPRPHTPFG